MSSGAGKKLLFHFHNLSFFTRNKEKRTGSDAYKVSGEHLEQFLPQDLYNLNVSHRTNLEDLEKHAI
jgi:hypothetical protein